MTDISVNLFFDYYPMSLSSLIENQVFNQDQIKFIIKSIFEGINYCHLCYNIVHRDLKPQVFLNTDYNYYFIRIFSLIMMEK